MAPSISELPPEIVAANKGPTIAAVISSITALATLFVVARIYVKAWMLKAVSVDDYIIVVSLVSCVLSALLLYSCG
jgi:hypothetical protein